MSRNASPDATGVGRARDPLVFLVIVAGLWIAWQILCNAVVLTAEPELALRLGPDAPSVLTRAAERELHAGRMDTARRYAQRALVRRPFNAAALRVAGLVADHDGDMDAADRLLTLAGNWSLRDDPAHSWLVKRRLEQGRSASALAHADTLMRRRVDVRPQHYDLMIALALRNDVQAQGALIELLRRKPPWRPDFIVYALKRREGVPVVAALALAMRDGVNPMTQEERAFLYRTLIAQGHIDVLQTLMAEGEGREAVAVSDGGFSREGGTPPFDWRLPASAGILAEVADDPDGQSALHAIINQSGRRTVIEQMVLLKPGRWQVSGRVRLAQGPQEGLAWALACATSGSELGLIPMQTGARGAWTRFTGLIDVPEACPAQYLRLVTLPRSHAETIEVWIDNVTAAPMT